MHDIPIETLGDGSELDSTVGRDPIAPHDAGGEM